MRHSSLTRTLIPPSSSSPFSKNSQKYSKFTEKKSISGSRVFGLHGITDVVG